MFNDTVSILIILRYFNIKAGLIAENYYCRPLDVSKFISKNLFMQLCYNNKEVRMRYIGLIQKLNKFYLYLKSTS